VDAVTNRVARVERYQSATAGAAEKLREAGSGQ